MQEIDRPPRRNGGAFGGSGSPRLIVYADEIIPGNVLGRADRKVWAIYKAFTRFRLGSPKPRELLDDYHWKDRFMVALTLPDITVKPQIFYRLITQYYFGMPLQEERTAPKSPKKP